MTVCNKYSGRQLRQRVTFERATKTGDSAGGWTEAWSTIGSSPRYAMLKTLSGREVHQHDRLEARPRVLCVTRYDATLEEADRVLHDGKAYNIRDIRNVDFADTWLEMDLDGGVAT